MILQTLRIIEKKWIQNSSKFFHKSIYLQGFEEFFDPKTGNEFVNAGRGWTVPDLRRKVFSLVFKLIMMY
jgi:hypothetical protein